MHGWTDIFVCLAIMSVCVRVSRFSFFALVFSLFGYIFVLPVC